ncbi:unnamed protein product [Adineta ricciae]|uniref:Uncharacterized protein n=1 Tax=Adineta ricciae TaxID=249248 RepID=A0A814PEW0_ADIRI|nr:unnamed protein product [Adineta ricciae]
MFEPFSVQKSIRIGEEKRFCRSVRFREDFPSELNGIVHPYEFHESIKNINRARRSSLLQIFANLILIICFIIGIAITIVGFALINNTDRTLWIVLIVIGAVVSVISIVVSSCLALGICSPHSNRLVEAIGSESMKYITRRPIPMKWRLQIDSIANQSYQYNPFVRGSNIYYSLAIDIGKKMDREVRKIYEPTSYLGQQSHLSLVY